MEEPEMRTFENALALLRARARPRRPQVTLRSALPQVAFPNGPPTFKGTPPIQGMKEWLHQLGHTDEAIDKLSIIHVAGTKGKGSTCALTEHILRKHGERTGFPRKTGLYTGPHLLHITERIRLNFKPISESLFAKYFYEVYDGLDLNEPDVAINDDLGPTQTKEPRYLQLLTLLSFHTFIRENVDLAIFETHNGGEYDPTNVTPHPIVTAITPIGIDHIHQLGPTIENIAWHKGGIFKVGAKAITAKQDESVMAVLKRRAREKVVDDLKEVSGRCFIGKAKDWPPVQQENLVVAEAICEEWLTKVVKGPTALLSDGDIKAAVDDFEWPGRFQVIKQDDLTWYLDGAHNELSIAQAFQWFLDTKGDGEGMVIFAQHSIQRDGVAVLRQLAEACPPSQSIILTSYDEDKGVVDETGNASGALNRYAGIWREIVSGGDVKIAKDIDEAMKLASETGSKEVLITGSLHLVAGALRVLEAAKTVALERNADEL